MPLVNVNNDVAGGTISNTQSLHTTNALPIIVLGDPVAAHSPPLSPHAVPGSMVGSGILHTIDGILICREGDNASCGHASVALGQAFYTSD